MDRISEVGDGMKVPGYMKSKRLSMFLEEQQIAQVSWHVEYH